MACGDVIPFLDLWRSVRHNAEAAEPADALFVLQASCRGPTIAVSEKERDAQNRKPDTLPEAVRHRLLAAAFVTPV
jgi:hypothetical protein